MRLFHISQFDPVRDVEKYFTSGHTSWYLANNKSCHLSLITPFVFYIGMCVYLINLLSTDCGVHDMLMEININSDQASFQHYSFLHTVMLFSKVHQNFSQFCYYK